MKKILNTLSIIMIVLMVTTSNLTVLADSTKVVTLGANLSDEQKQLILNYFATTENEVDVITVTNEDEHRYLDGIATQQQIGKRTFSCAYIEPTNQGGIHIKTVNLTWVTCEMIRNALVTSGINNCNVVCASPIEVSGTGALTGIFMAYEQVNGEELSEEKVELASEELVTTMDIAETIGQEEASLLLSELKENIIVDSINNQEDIQAIIDQYISLNNIQLTEEQKWELINLLLKISQQEYDIEEIKKAYEDVKNTVEDIKQKSEETLNVLEKIGNWFKETFQKMSGTYEEVKESEKYQEVKDQLGILTQTNDSLLGENTVVTVTEDEDTLQIVEEVETVNTEQSNKEDKPGFFESIKLFFQNFFGNKDNSIENKPETEIETEIETENTEGMQEQITFENFDASTENSIEDNIISENSITQENNYNTYKEDEKSTLDIITEEGMPNENDYTKSFDELTK